MIRAYQSKDFAALMKLFDQNAPQYFALEEKQDFKDYLQQHLEWYFVIEIDEEIIGCGGVNFKENKTQAFISWDLIHPDFQRKGFGKELLQFRISKIKKVQSVENIYVRTSQFVYLFYEKNGFYLIGILKNYWAKNYHLYDMIYTR